MNFLILGYGRHGKDTVSELLRDVHGYEFADNSMVVAEAIYEQLGYEDAQACYDDRHNGDNRQRWYKAIQELNAEDKNTYTKMVYAKSQVRCGLRDIEEFTAAKEAKLFDVCIWVDRSDVEPTEDESSCTVTPELADYVLDNNGDLKALKKNLEQTIFQIRADMFGIDLDKLKKAKKSKKTFALRRAFKLLSKEEHAKLVKLERRAEKAERGMAKMWMLLGSIGV